MESNYRSDILKAVLQEYWYDNDKPLKTLIEIMTPEINKIITQSNVFKNPPNIILLFSISNGTVGGEYDQETNTIYMAMDILKNSNYNLFKTDLAHELSHAMQDQYNHIDRLPKVQNINKALKSMNKNNQSNYHDAIYYNDPQERQAQLVNIINDFPPNVKIVSYQDLNKALSINNHWQAIDKYLYPENKIKIKKALFKHFTESVINTKT